MPIPLRPPIPDEAAWKAHAQSIAYLAGGVCFSALVAHYGVRSPKALESRVFGTSTGDHREPSGIFRRWWRYGSVPDPETASLIRQRTAGAVDLTYWRELPLYALLAREPPPINWLQQLRESMPKPILQILFQDGRPIRDRWVHLRSGRADLLKLRARPTLASFTTLLSLAREGEILGHDPSHFLPTACAYDMLPRVLLATPPLLAVWDRLFTCLDLIFFRRSYAGGMYFEFSQSDVANALTSLPTDPRFRWPLAAGRNV